MQAGTDKGITRFYDKQKYCKNSGNKKLGAGNTKKFPAASSDRDDAGI